MGDGWNCANQWGPTLDNVQRPATIWSSRKQSGKTWDECNHPGKPGTIRDHLERYGTALSNPGKRGTTATIRASQQKSRLILNDMEQP